MPVAPTGEYIYSPALRQSSVVRNQISRYGFGTIGIRVTNPSTGPVDADADTVVLNVYQETSFEDTDPVGPLIITATQLASEIAHPETGVYTYTLTPPVTNVVCLLRAVWTYQVDGVSLTYIEHLMIRDSMPFYDSFNEDEKDVIHLIWAMFGDLYDSTTGGPHLMEEFQSKFNSERIAQLLQIAVGRINLKKQPLTYWSLPGGFPMEFSGLLVMAGYIEVIKHFIRTYVEQPDIRNADVSYTDRRDYLQRWQSVLQMEQEDLNDMTTLVKRKQLNLGSGSLLVSGGIFGGSGGRGLFISGTYAAQTRSMRFYPAAPSVSWGAVTGFQ